MQLLRYLGRLLGCCYVVARLLGCCYAVARVPRYPVSQPLVSAPERVVTSYSLIWLFDEKKD